MNVLIAKGNNLEAACYILVLLFISAVSLSLSLGKFLYHSFPDIPSSFKSKPVNMDGNGSSSKKRKIWFGEDDEEEDDEIKMEKFFTLVRSIRESRERLTRLGSDANGDTENGSCQVKNRAGVWKPQFQIEDFMEQDPHHQNRSPPNLSLADHASHDNNKKSADEEREAEMGMNLSLSL